MVSIQFGDVRGFLILSGPPPLPQPTSLARSSSALYRRVCPILRFLLPLPSLLDLCPCLPHWGLGPPRVYGVGCFQALPSCPGVPNTTFSLNQQHTAPLDPPKMMKEAS